LIYRERGQLFFRVLASRDQTVDGEGETAPAAYELYNSIEETPRITSCHRENEVERGAVTVEFDLISFWIGTPLSTGITCIIGTAIVYPH